MTKDFGYNKGVFKKDKGIDEFKKFLLELCDEDYSGRSGEDYFIDVVDESGKTTKISNFEAHWRDLVKSNELQYGKIAQAILDDCYSSDSNYYLNNMIFVHETENEVIVAAAYIYAA